MKLIRLAFDRLHPVPFLVEYGKKRQLTPEEESELEILHGELMEYSDFSTAQEIQETQRQTLMVKKRRLEELEAVKRGDQEITWEQQDDIETILLMIRPGFVNVYVENLPSELFDKLLLDTHIHLNITQAYSPPGQLATEEGPKIEHYPDLQQPRTPQDPRILEVKRTIASMPGISSEGVPWEQLVIITLENPAQGQATLSNSVYVMPIKYLHKDWSPINDKIKEVYGNRHQWVRADKESHWRISF